LKHYNVWVKFIAVVLNRRARLRKGASIDWKGAQAVMRCATWKVWSIN